MSERELLRRLVLAGLVLSRKPCIVDGCPNHARVAAGYERKMCSTHEYRQRHGIPLDAPIRPRGQTRNERLAEAARVFAESDGSLPLWENPGWNRLRMAAAAFGKKRRARRHANA